MKASFTSEDGRSITQAKDKKTAGDMTTLQESTFTQAILLKTSGMDTALWSFWQETMMSSTKESGRMALSMESASKEISMARSILDLGFRERKMDTEG